MAKSPLDDARLLKGGAVDKSLQRAHRRVDRCGRLPLPQLTRSGVLATTRQSRAQHSFPFPQRNLPLTTEGAVLHLKPSRMCRSTRVRANPNLDHRLLGRLNPARCLMPMQ